MIHLMMFVCFDCGDAFQSQDIFSNHSCDSIDETTIIIKEADIKRHNETKRVQRQTAKNISNSKVKGESSGNIKCPLKCPKLFPKDQFMVKQAIRSHLIYSRLHKGEKKSDLIQILKEFPSLNCEICGTLLNSYANLKAHFKNVHTEVKMVPCPKCKASDKLYKECYLKDHLLKCHSDLVECNECGNQFNSYNIKRHIRVVHKKVKKHSCHICDFVAAEKRTMRVHILSVHQKARPFQCDECDFTCARIDNLNNHRTIMHAATNKLTLSDYGENITWNTVENMFSAQAIEKSSENQLFSTSEGDEKLPPSSVSVPTLSIALSSEDGKIVSWEEG